VSINEGLVSLNSLSYDFLLYVLHMEMEVSNTIKIRELSTVPNPLHPPMPPIRPAVS